MITDKRQRIKNCPLYSPSYPSFQDTSIPIKVFYGDSWEKAIFFSPDTRLNRPHHQLAGLTIMRWLSYFSRKMTSRPN